MKQSYHINYNQTIYNLKSSPFLNHVHPMIMNRMKSTDEVIGINCFNEFLTFGDFLVYTQAAFPNKEFS